MKKIFLTLLATPLAISSCSCSSNNKPDSQPEIIDWDTLTNDMNNLDTSDMHNNRINMSINNHNLSRILENGYAVVDSDHYEPFDIPINIEYLSPINGEYISTKFPLFIWEDSNHTDYQVWLERYPEFLITNQNWLWWWVDEIEWTSSINHEYIDPFSTPFDCFVKYETENNDWEYIHSLKSGDVYDDLVGSSWKPYIDYCSQIAKIIN